MEVVELGPLAHARGYLMTTLLVCLAAAATAADPLTLNGRTMGTTWSVKFVQPAPPIVAARVELAVAQRLEQLEQLFSTYRLQSELSLFNANPSTDWISAAPELVRVADESRRISALTHGAFDVTVLPLVELWGFGAMRRTAALPTASEVSATRARVDWRRLETRTQPPALRKSDAGVTVDFSSVAKGFSADEISAMLTRLGAPNHLVHVGGDVKAGGNGPEARGWRVAIEAPTGDRTSSARVVVLRDAAVSTSGAYRNSFVVEGRRYGHIIDPRRGEPVSGALASVSVVHASCATSSAFATALFVLGTEEGYRFATEQRLAGLFYAREGDVVKARETPSFEAMQKP